MHRPLPGLGTLSMVVLAALLGGGCGPAPTSLAPTMPPPTYPSVAPPPATATAMPSATSSATPIALPAPVPTPPRATPTPALATVATPSRRGCIVNTSTLNMREGPSKQFHIVGRMARGTLFEAAERTGDASWVFGASRAANGWASAAYLECTYNLGQLPVAQVLPPTYTPVAPPAPYALPLLYTPIAAHPGYNGYSSLDMDFEVIYPGQDGLSLREGPSRSRQERATLHAGTELAVLGYPQRGEDRLKWWPVSSPQGDGWVAEATGNWRLIKPLMGPGGVVEVANPTGTGKVYLRDQNCRPITLLSRGTELTIIAGPETKCDRPGSAIVAQGRRWWYVETSDGTQGWIADFSEDDQAMLIAPRWYVEVTDQVPPP
jgi:hypothetical protein